jgi:hypothetical protein
MKRGFIKRAGLGGDRFYSLHPQTLLCLSRFKGNSADVVLLLVGMHGLSEAYQIVRAHANDTSARTVNVRNESERDGQN